MSIDIHDLYYFIITIVTYLSMVMQIVVNCYLSFQRLSVLILLLWSKDLLPTKTFISFFAGLSIKVALNPLPAINYLYFIKNEKFVPDTSLILNAYLYITSAKGCLISLQIKASIYQTLLQAYFLFRMLYCSIQFILVKSVPVLSKAIVFIVFIFQKTEVFLIKMPLLRAKLSIFATTLGIARPRAQGHEATSTPIPLSMIQQISHAGTQVRSKKRMIDQTAMVVKLSIITPLTK